MTGTHTLRAAAARQSPSCSSPVDLAHLFAGAGTSFLVGSALAALTDYARLAGD